MTMLNELGATAYQGGRRRKPFAAECKVAIHRHPVHYNEHRGMIELIIPDWVGIVRTVWLRHSHNLLLISLVVRTGYTKHAVQENGRITHNTRSPVVTFGRHGDKLTRIDSETYAIPLVRR
jgi:hypothetical protein